jgi:GcrA cell cycle regulator
MARPSTGGVTAAWPEQRVTQLRKLWAEGLTSTQIAKLLHTSRSAVCGKVCRLGLYRRAKATTPYMRVCEAFSDRPAFVPYRPGVDPKPAWLH